MCLQDGSEEETVSYEIEFKPKVVPSVPPTYERNFTYNYGPAMRRAGVDPQHLGGLTLDELYQRMSQAYVLIQDNPAYFEQFIRGDDTVDGLLELLKDLYQEALCLSEEFGGHDYRVMVY